MNLNRTGGVFRHPRRLSRAGDYDSADFTYDGLSIGAAGVPLTAEVVLRVAAANV